MVDRVSIWIPFERRPTFSCECLVSVAVLLVSLIAVGCEQPTPDVSSPSTTTDKEIEPVDEMDKILSGKKVLVVHSYHKEYEWVAQITRGIKRSFEKSCVQLEQFYMDTKQRSDLNWKIEAGEAAHDVVRRWKPDVIIAVDDNAQEYFAKKLAGLDWPDVVFCGVNASPENYGYPANNVTGILERPNFVATLRMLKDILPSVRRIAVISDNSPTSAGAMEYMKNENVDVEAVCWKTPDTFEEWKNAVLEVQDTADAIVTYMYHTVRADDAVRNMTPRDVMEWTVENSKIPVVGFFVFSIDDGALCGAVESGTEHGWEAGKIALEILKGKSAGDFPVQTAKRTQAMLNLEAARRLGITVGDQVLENTDIILHKKEAEEESD